MVAVVLAGCGSFELEVRLPEAIGEGTEIRIDGVAQRATPVWRSYDAYDDYAAAPLVLEIRDHGATIDSRPLDLSYVAMSCDLRDPSAATLTIYLPPDLHWAISTAQMTGADHDCHYAVRAAP
jgi:hypothetical protein